MKDARGIAEPYRVTSGRRFRLRDFDPADVGPFVREGKEHAERLIERRAAEIGEMQERLYAQDRWSVLLVLQGMDAAGKDGVIEHALADVDPQGCQVTAFKAPTSDELEHDWLWRCVKALPERGRIGVFNRSYYEEVLVVRLHPEILAAQKLPPSVVTKHVWKQRLEDIASHELHLARNGTAVVKVFLHVSKEEQAERLLSRLDEPAKRWKFSGADLRERALWKPYMAAYEDAIRATAAPHAPWYVVPADHKWFARAVVASAIAAEMGRLELAYPQLDAARRKELDAVRKGLEAQVRRKR